MEINKKQVGHVSVILLILVMLFPIAFLGKSYLYSLHSMSNLRDYYQEKDATFNVAVRILEKYPEIHSIKKTNLLDNLKDRKESNIVYRGYEVESLPSEFYNADRMKRFVAEIEPLMAGLDLTSLYRYANRLVFVDRNTLHGTYCWWYMFSEGTPPEKDLVIEFSPITNQWYAVHDL